MSILSGKTYEDKKGRLYRVMKGDNGFRAMYVKPDRAGWHCDLRLPLRTTQEEAQRDLDALAIEKVWKSNEAPSP